MPRLKPSLIAWGVAGICFAVSAAAIMSTRPMYVARAAAEINKTDLSPDGIAAFTHVDFGATNRMMPNEIVFRLRSRETVRRALRGLHLPDDESAVRDAAERTTVRLVPGTTLIETSVRAESPQAARDIAGQLYVAYEAMRRERRTLLAQSLVAALDAAMKELLEESRTVSEKLAALDVYAAPGAGLYSRDLDAAFVNLASSRARLEASLRRLEAIRPDDVEGMSRELDDVAHSAVSTQPVAERQGYLELRAQLAARRGELAQLQSQFGDQSPRVESAKAELAALVVALRDYCTGQVSQMRAQLAATEKAGAAIDSRVLTKQQREVAIQVALASPECESLRLRRDAIRGQLSKLELRRRELLLYGEVHQAAFSALDPPLASDAPEVAYRNARLVLAGFGALLTGISLSIILNRRTADVL